MTVTLNTTSIIHHLSAIERLLSMSPQNYNEEFTEDVRKWRQLKNAVAALAKLIPEDADSILLSERDILKWIRDFLTELSEAWQLAGEDGKLYADRRQADVVSWITECRGAQLERPLEE